MPAPYPREVRDDVVRVALSRGDGVVNAQSFHPFLSVRNTQPSNTPNSEGLWHLQILSYQDRNKTPGRFKASPHPTHRRLPRAH